MAPMESSSPKRNDDSFPLAEIIFSCNTCQATVSDVYATKEDNHGFYGGSGNDDGIVTKMWIADCSHITCAKHLENGAPLHPIGRPPRAPCPRCVQEKGDNAAKNLYAIRGLGEDECDSAIPTEWLNVPAARLDAATPEMQALRYQYMALCHYARQVRKHWKDAVKTKEKMEAAYSKEQKVQQQVEAELQKLKKEVESLKESEVKLKKWQAREPVINHYMHSFGQLASDYGHLRRRFQELGYHVPSKNYQYDSRQPNGAPHQEENQYSNTAVRLNENDGAQIARYPANESESSSSGRKRKREEQATLDYSQSNTQPLQRRTSSRDLMPPPLHKSKQHQQGIAAHPRHTPIQSLHRPQSSIQAIHIHEDERWMPGPTERRRWERDEVPQHAYAEDDFRQPTELPFRPLPARNDHSALFSQPYRPDERTSAEDIRFPNQTMEYSRSIPPATQRSSIASDDRRARAHSQTCRHSFERESHIFQDEQAVPRQHEDSITSRRHHERPRLPLQALPESVQNQQRLTHSRARDPYTTPSPRRSNQAEAASVISPFFTRDSAMQRPTNLQRPPTRGNYIRPWNGDVANHTSRVNDMSRQRTNNQFPLRQSESANRTSFLNHIIKPSQNPSHQSSGYTQNTAAHYQRLSPASQTQRNSQGMFSRPDGPQPSASYGTGRPQSNISREQRTLPLNNGSAMATASNQDEALAQVRGIRGVSSRRGLSSYQHFADMNHASSELYTSASGRRSVRR